MQGQNQLSVNNNASQQNVLKTENLSKSYVLKRKKVSVLKNLLLEIKRGEFVAIMGHSGSGKTTLLNMIGCLDKPTDGRILIDDIDVSKMPDSQLFKVQPETRSVLCFKVSTFCPISMQEKMWSSRWRAPRNQGPKEVPERESFLQWLG